MNDELQNLWQEQPIRKEDTKMWAHLIQEKESGFGEIVRLGNQMEYLAALIMAPLLSLCAWKAKFAVGRAGFAVAAFSFAAGALVTYLMHRQRPQSYDRSLRDQLSALIADYDRRIRFLRNGKALMTMPIGFGIIAVILSVPGAFGSLVAWSAVVLVVLLLTVGQWRAFVVEKASILAKRQDAENLLRELGEK